MIDLELSVEPPSDLDYMGVWGDSWKGLNQVSPIPAPIDPEPLDPAIQTAIDTFEAPAGNPPIVQGQIGIYGKNLRTNQSISYRGDEPFYLASVTKWSVHVHLWRRFDTVELVETDVQPYTNDIFSGAPWYMDERCPGSNPSMLFGFGTGAPNGCSGDGYNMNDLGLSWELSRFDDAMMTKSDNAATSALVDSTFVPLGRTEPVGAAWATPDLNKWIAGIPGVGKGWGVTTSIQDIDRIVLWQGQKVPAHAAGATYFDVPGHTAAAVAVRALTSACTENIGQTTDRLRHAELHSVPHVRRAARIRTMILTVIAKEARDLRGRWTIRGVTSAPTSASPWAIRFRAPATAWVRNATSARA